MKDARNYLASETLKQIKEGKLTQYIESKKLKDKEKFKKYVEAFSRKDYPKTKSMNCNAADPVPILFLVASYTYSYHVFTSSWILSAAAALYPIA